MRPQDHPQFDDVRSAMRDVLIDKGLGDVPDDAISWNLAARAVDLLHAPPTTGVTARNIAIAEALGLNPHHIRKDGVTITLDGDLGPLVTVEYKTMGESMISDFAGVVQRYRLVPIDEDDSPTRGDLMTCRVCGHTGPIGAPNPKGCCINLANLDPA